MRMIYIKELDSYINIDCIAGFFPIDEGDNTYEMRYLIGKKEFGIMMSEDSVETLIEIIN